jgi:hypothetical protein
MPCPPRTSRRYAFVALRAAVAVVFACAWLAHAEDLGTPIEDEAVVDAASLVQPALLSGPGFAVDPHVELRGYMAHFMLDTRVGPLNADSVEILADREAELDAIDAIDRVTRSDAFIHVAGAKFVSTGKALGKIVMHPIDTVIGIPAGVARYFGAKLKKIGTQAQTASDRVAKELGTSGNAYPSDEGPMTDARGGDADAARPKREKHWYSSVTSEAGREVKRQLKYSEVKRELAKALGIDPYSGNPYVQARLSELAWVGTGGNFSATSALGAVGGAGAVVLSNGGKINEVVWKLSPDDLRARNNDRLHAYCRDEWLMRQFLRRGVFSPTLQTGLIDALDQLQPSGGGDALLELGMTAHSELESRFIVNALRMTAKYLGDRAHDGALRPIGAGLAYEAGDGELVLPLPVDVLSWTAEVRDFLDRPAFRVRNKTVLIGGNASLSARRGLTERGWNIVLRAPWPGAPPYAAFDEPASGEDGSALH